MPVIIEADLLNTRKFNALWASGRSNHPAVLLLITVAAISAFFFLRSYGPLSEICSLFHHVEYFFEADLAVYPLRAVLYRGFIDLFAEHCYRPFSEALIYIPLNMARSNNPFIYTQISVYAGLLTLLCSSHLIFEFTRSYRAAAAALLLLSVSRAGSTQLYYFVTINAMIADASAMLGVSLFMAAIRKSSNKLLGLSAVLMVISLFSKENMVLLPLFLLLLLALHPDTGTFSLMRWKSLFLSRKNAQIFWNRRLLIAVLVIISLSALMVLSSRIWWQITHDPAMEEEIYREAFTEYITRNIRAYIWPVSGYVALFLVLSFTFRGISHSPLPPLIWTLIPAAPYVITGHADWPLSVAVGPAALVGMALFPEKTQYHQKCWFLFPRLNKYFSNLMKPGYYHVKPGHYFRLIAACLVLLHAAFTSESNRAISYERQVVHARETMIHRYLYRHLSPLRDSIRDSSNVVIDLRDMFIHLPDDYLKMEFFNGLGGMLRFILEAENRSLHLLIRISANSLAPAGEISGLPWHDLHTETSLFKWAFPAEDESVYLLTDTPSRPDEICFVITSTLDHGPVLDSSPVGLKRAERISSLTNSTTLRFTRQKKPDKSARFIVL